MDTSRAISTQQRFLTAGEAASMLGVSPKTISRWASNGRIPCAVTLGGHRRFRLDVIQRLADQLHRVADWQA